MRQVVTLGCEFSGKFEVLLGLQGESHGRGIVSSNCELQEHVEASVIFEWRSDPMHSHPDRYR